MAVSKTRRALLVRVLKKNPQGQASLQEWLEKLAKACRSDMNLAKGFRSMWNGGRNWGGVADGHDLAHCMAQVNVHARREIFPVDLIVTIDQACALPGLAHLGKVLTGKRAERSVAKFDKHFKEVLDRWFLQCEELELSYL